MASDDFLDDELYAGLCASYGGRGVEPRVYGKLLSRGLVQPRKPGAFRTWLTDEGRSALATEERRRAAYKPISDAPAEDEDVDDERAPEEHGEANAAEVQAPPRKKVQYAIRVR